jgi:hypothetical protein
VSVHHGLEEAMATRFARDGRASDSRGRGLATGVWEVKKGRLVHHRVCRCAEG